jgi:hypothetical protein
MMGKEWPASEAILVTVYPIRGNLAAKTVTALKKIGERQAWN